jgi:outer membrane lipoprotein-sorting protein
VTSRQVIENNDEQMSVQDEKSQVTMKLINKRGKERKRQVVLYSKKDRQDNDKTLIRFLAPADVKGVGLLSIEDGNREDQWLYLPALKRVRRISSSEKTDNFMGSDFSYEDIEQNDLDDYEYTLLREEEIQGAECYVIQSIPVDEQVKKETAYSKVESWIRKDNHITVKVNFYNKKGDLMKIMEASDIRRIGNTDKWRAYFIVMQNEKTGHRTELHYEDIQINQGIADKYFTQRYLERER